MSAHNAIEKDEPFPALVLLLGKTGVGKSTFIKTATGLDVDIGGDLTSCTPPGNPYRNDTFDSTNHTNLNEQVLKKCKSTPSKTPTRSS